MPQTAADWGLINRVVPSRSTGRGSTAFLGSCTRGSFLSKGIGKQAYYAQIDLPQRQAYTYAIEVMASSSQLPDAQEVCKHSCRSAKPRFQRPSSALFDGRNEPT